MNQPIFWILSSFIWSWAYTLGYAEMSGQANVYAGIASLALGTAISLFSRGILSFGNSKLWVVLLFILPLNVAGAFDQTDAIIRWALFLVLFKLACSFTQNTPEVFYKGYTLWLPLALAVVMLADVYARRSGSELYDENAKGAGHAITLYATLLAAIAPFGRRFGWTLLIWIFCVTFIYLSGSRGALFGMLPVFVVSLAYYASTSRRSEALTVFCFLVAVGLTGPIILELFGQMKLASTSQRTAWESVNASLETRIQLARNSWELVMQQPWTGWGNGQSYNRVQGLYESVAVHTLWVITLLQFGIPLGILINLYVISIPIRITISRSLPVDLKWLSLSVFAAYFFRSTFEPISFFDLGSMWSFAHLVLFVYVVSLLSLTVTLPLQLKKRVAEGSI